MVLTVYKRSKNKSPDVPKTNNTAKRLKVNIIKLNTDSILAIIFIICCPF